MKGEALHCRTFVKKNFELEIDKSENLRKMKGLSANKREEEGREVKSVRRVVSREGAEPPK